MEQESANKAGRKERPGRPRAKVDTGKILALYQDKKLSVRQVAGLVGVSHTTVARRIAEETGQLRAWRLPGEE